MSSTAARPAPMPEEEADTSYPWKVLATVIFGLFMVILDATVVNVALRTLQQQYRVGTNEVQWVVSLYTLALGVSTPLSGFLGDRFGVKRTYLGALVLFVIGSVLCGLAPSLPLLIAARAIQGVGGGISQPLGTAMLFGAFPPAKRGAAFGIFGIVVVFAPAIGPLLGGWLVDIGQLPWIFFINVPIGIVGVTLGSRFLRENRPARRPRPDIAGIILAPLGFGSILFGASIAGEGGGWGDPRTLTAFAVGLIALAVLVVVELRIAEPLLDLRLFAIRSYAIGNAAAAIGTIALFGSEFLLPLYLQVLRGKTAFEAGLMLLPLAIASAFSGFLGGRIADRLGPRPLIVVGFALLAFNTYQLAQIQLDTDLGFITFLLVLRGIGLGLIIQNSQVAALVDVSFPKLTRATTLLNATRQTMQSLGVAVLATILARALTVTAPRSPAEYAQFRAEYIVGLQNAYLATFCVALVAMGLSLFLPGWPAPYTPAGRRSGPPAEAQGARPSGAEPAPASH